MRPPPGSRAQVPPLRHGFGSHGSPPEGTGPGVVPGATGAGVTGAGVITADKRRAGRGARGGTGGTSRRGCLVSRHHTGIGGCSSHDDGTGSRLVFSSQGGAAGGRRKEPLRFADASFNAARALAQDLGSEATKSHARFHHRSRTTVEQRHQVPVCECSVCQKYDGSSGAAGLPMVEMMQGAWPLRSHSG